MKNTALLFNTNQIGGAERSMAYQCLELNKIKKASEDKIICYIPALGSKDTLSTFLQQLGLETREYYYPLSYYQLSRQRLLPSVYSLIQMTFSVFKLIKEWKQFLNYETIYANGNKVAVLAFIILPIISFRGRFFWHWRDYPSKKFPWFILRFYYSFLIKNKFQIVMIANSYSVENEIRQKVVAKLNIPTMTVYNPVGQLSPKSIPVIQNKKSITLGVVSMLAPWKGIFQIILWAKLYQRDLEELGVSAIAIYGGSIYQTNGEHCGHEKQLHDLKTKIGSDLIQFKGQEKPEYIFKQIDVLIHPVIEDEPFGRTLLESMRSGVPVISTRLGGADEVLGDCGLHFFPFDYQSLFQQVKKLVKGNEIYNLQVQNGLVRAKEIERLSIEQLKQLAV